MASCARTPEIRIAPTEFDALKGQDGIHIVYHLFDAIDTMHYSRCTQRRWEKYGGDRCISVSHQNFQIPPVTDPLSTIQAIFATELKKRLNVDNIESIRRDRSGSDHPLSLGERSLEKGRVFNFNTLIWRVDATGDTYQPPPGSGKNSFELWYAAQGTFARDGEPAFLWKAQCEVKLPFWMSDLLYDQYLADKNLFVIDAKRDEAATQCADQLIERFFEQ